MIANILNTISTRIVLAIAAILLLLLNSNFLGSEGLGEIGILVLSIAIFILFTNIICGGSLIYYASKMNKFQLLVTAYFWISFIGLAYMLLTQIFPYLVTNHKYDILLLGIMQSAIGANLNLLMGIQKVKTFNRITVAQTIIQITAISIGFMIMDKRSVSTFIYSTYLAYSIVLLLSFYQVFKILDKSIKPPKLNVLKTLFNYGIYLQIANVSQLLNYRLSYFLLKFYSGLSSVGIFMAGVQISEGILLPSKSIGVVQYSRISNTKSKQKSALMTVRLLKIVLLITLIAILFLISIPSKVYVYFLGNDFNDVQLVVLIMSLGILSLAGEIILSRYFSGTAQQKTNAISSTVGLVVTCTSGFILIPSFGLIGAAITSSLSFISIFIFLLNRMLVKTELKLQDFYLKKDDILFAKKLYFMLKRKR